VDPSQQKECPQLADLHESFRRARRESERLAFDIQGHPGYDQIGRRDRFEVVQAIAETEAARVALVEHAATHGCGEVKTIFPHRDGATEAVYIHRAAPVAYPFATLVPSKAERR
jgi:hypothetical protein